MPCRCIPAVDITIYRTTNSAEGIQAQAYFLRKGIAFEDFDISTNSQAKSKIEEISGQTERPVILVNQKSFVGFNPDDLDLVVPSLF